MKIEIGKTSNIIGMYFFMFQHLTQALDVGVVKHMMADVKKRIERSKATLNWNFSEENIDLLFRCVHDAKSMDDAEWTEPRNEFIIAAFKDLSTQRDPLAMEVFEKLRALLHLNDGELLLWSRTVTKRPDGSAVITLHVSDMEVFTKMLETQSGHGFLEEGLMVYR